MDVSGMEARTMLWTIKVPGNILSRKQKNGQLRYWKRDKQEINVHQVLQVKIHVTECQLKAANYLPLLSADLKRDWPQVGLHLAICEATPLQSNQVRCLFN